MNPTSNGEVINVFSFDQTMPVNNAAALMEKKTNEFVEDGLKHIEPQESTSYNNADAFSYGFLPGS